MADAEREHARRKGRPPRPWKNEQDLRIDMSPEELAKAVLSGKGVEADGE